jgi:hypothetical protein
MLISSQIFYKSLFMLIAKSSWSKICISWFDFTINIKSISLLRTWLIRTIDALNRISTKNASHWISINTSQIMKKMRTNERQECNNKRRHELKKRYERKFILFRTTMMKSRFERNKHRLKNRLERNKHRLRQSRLLEFKKRRRKRRRYRLKRIRRRKKRKWLKRKKRKRRITELLNKIT